MGLPGSESPYSDWWVWVHNHENIVSGLVSGDLPENGPGYWHLYKTDHELAEKLGMDIMRGCIDWSRIFPKPTFNVEVDVHRDEYGNITYIEISEKAIQKLDEIADKKAVDHYREILLDWKKRGKTLILNLYHWPIPLWLHDPIKVRRLGPDRAPSGWLDKKTIVEFVKYVTYIAYKLGDLVDLWSTMNEPNVIYEQGYRFIKSGFPPGYLSFEASRKVAKNLVEAHARAYEAIHEYSDKPVGIIYVLPWIETIDEASNEELEGIKRETYAFLDSICHGRSSIVGDRPDLRKHVDWIGVNYYSRMVYGGKPLKPQGGYGFLCGSRSYSRDGRPCSDFGWEIYPEGLGRLLREVWKKYDTPLFVSENGIADATDKYRSYYIVSHLVEVYNAIKEGVDVKGYLHWSLTDNYEWASGFKMRFGLVYVDYETKKRYLRPSALVFREIAINKAIPEELQHLSKISILSQNLG